MRIYKTFFIISTFAFVSCVVAASAGDVYSRKFDEFHFVGWRDTMARLDDLAADLKQSTGNAGVFIIYGERRGWRGESQAWYQCSKDYLVRRHGISADRIVFIDGGYLDTLTVEVWLWPRKGPLPQPSNISSKDVRLRKGRIKNWQTFCKQVSESLGTQAPSNKSLNRTRN